MTQLKKHSFYLISFLLLVLLALPLYLLNYKEEGLLTLGLVGLYLVINKIFDVLIFIGAKLKWHSVSIILVGFFAIKNIFFLSFLALAWKHDYLSSNWSILIVLMLYGIYSFLLGRKMTYAKYD